MTSQEKKTLVEKKMSEGDTRSYNELMADLELQIWTEKHKGPEWVKKQLSNSRYHPEVNALINDNQ